MTPQNQLALIVSLFLSKFDALGYEALGYQSWSNAFEGIGNSLQVKPSTIKQMREQFDPLFPNPRVGWYQRPLSPTRIEAMQQFGSLSFPSFLKLVESILKSAQSPAQLDPIIELMRTPALETPKTKAEKRESEKEFVNVRGKTGRLAEKYFMELFHAKALPYEGNLIDRRDDGCGYDFLIEGQTLQAVEVKGLAPIKGDLLFTNREWKTSQTLPHYSVFVAFNLAATKDDWRRRIIESAQLVDAIQTEQTVVQTNWRFVPNW